MANHFFKWSKIAVNTWVGRTPNGWIIKSVDTKTRQDNNFEDKLLTAMSSSLVELYDPTHSWKFNKFRWENIELDTWRARVIGGWIVKSSHTLGDERVSSSMVFTPDPSWGWEILKPQNNTKKQSKVFSNQENKITQSNREDIYILEKITS